MYVNVGIRYLDGERLRRAIVAGAKRVHTRRPRGRRKGQRHGTGGDLGKPWTTGGKISPVAPIVGRRGLTRKLLALARGAMRSMGTPVAAVAHAAAPSAAERLAADLSAAGAADVHVSPASPALGVHAGTGAVGVALLDRDWLEARIRELSGNPDVK